MRVVIRWMTAATLGATLIGTPGCSRHEGAEKPLADQPVAADCVDSESPPPVVEREPARDEAPRDDARFAFTPTPHRTPTTKAEIYEDYAAAKLRLRMSWTDDLRAAGAHGGEGVVPPMLEVVDSGQGVEVTNTGKEPLCLDLRRSTAKVGGLEYQCALWSQRGALHSCVKYAPGQKEFLRMSSARPDLPDCSGQPLEFRVGTWEEKGPGWWSDVAIDAYDQETARLETDKTLYASLIAVPTDLWENDFIIEVTRSMEAMPVGPPRVAMWEYQIDAAKAGRRMRPNEDPQNRASRASHMNQVAEVEAQLQEVKSLRERMTHMRADERNMRFPDYLPVQDQLDHVTVTHTLGAVFYVNLARVGTDPQTGKEYVCEMHGLGRGTSAGTYVSKDEPGNFEVISRSGPCENLEGTQLEMLVYNFDGNLTFGTPSALERLQAKIEARLKTIQACR